MNKYRYNLIKLNIFKQVIMKTNLRYKRIEDLLKNNGDMTVKEMAYELNVSEATIRRDLLKMEETNLIERLWGGAKVLTSDSDNIIGSPYIDSNSDYSMRFYKNAEIKRKIAKCAASQIKNGSCIFIDSGSTTSFICEYIEAKEISVVTNNINILQVLAKKGINTYLTSGYINFSSASIVSYETSQDLKHFNFDMCFLGCGGIDKKTAYSTKDNFDYLIKKTVCEKSNKIFVLADKRKFEKQNPFTFCELKNATLISDDQVDYISDSILVF